MKYFLSNPFQAFSGTFEGCDLIFARNPVTGSIYTYGRPTWKRKPLTEGQAKTQTTSTLATRAWSHLSPQVRDDWNRFAKLFASEAKPRRGLDVCREAQRMRLLLNLPVTTTAPRLGFPAEVTAVMVEEASDPREFQLKLNHAVEAPAGYVALVRITPATQSPARQPETKYLRGICGTGSKSTAPLPADGGTITFTGARFAIDPGRRFGVEVKVVRLEDGLASRPMFFDVVRPGTPPTP